MDNYAYIEIEILDETSTEGLSYKKPVKIMLLNTIDEIAQIINSAEEWETIDDELGAGDYLEGCPVVTVYKKETGAVSAPGQND